MEARSKKDKVALSFIRGRLLPTRISATGCRARGENERVIRLRAQ